MSALKIPKGEKVPEPGTVDFADWLVLNIMAFLKELDTRTKGKSIQNLSMILCVQQGDAGEDSRKSKLLMYGSNKLGIDAMNGVYRKLVDQQIEEGVAPHMAAVAVAREVLKSPKFMGDNGEGIFFNHETKTVPSTET